ncbi:MAG: DUF2306 domain-containing protein [Pseudomonadota bacterium]
MNSKSRTSFWLWPGWIAVALILLTLIIFSIIRTLDTYGGSVAENVFEARYIQHPVITAIHMISGMAFVLLAPLQFISRIRTRHRKLHRLLGRVLIAAALISGVYGLVTVVVFPVYGGLAASSAGWFFGPIFLFCVMRGVWHARNKRFVPHREWMIRSFALGLGVGMQRILIGVFVASAQIPISESFGPSLWLGFAINLLIAELWITKTRTTPPSRAASTNTA